MISTILDARQQRSTMSQVHANDFVNRVITDDAYRKEVAAKLPRDFTYKAGKSDELIAEVAIAAGEKGYRMTKEELRIAVDTKMNELGVLKTTKLAMKIKKELDNR